MAAPPPKRVRSVSFDGPMTAFARHLSEDATLIESRCKRCGEMIVGSVLHGLAEQESEHQEHCPAARIASGQ